MATQLERSREQREQEVQLQDDLSKLGPRSSRWKMASVLGALCIAEGGLSYISGLAQQNDAATFLVAGAGAFGLMLSLAGQCDVIENRVKIKHALENPQ